ncbi:MULTISPECIES: PAS domain-containing protein [unclassified Halorhodospira]|uniref:PAS domain-containing protein n=1 Tax=unclassified Halorhodospira TaxID=2626748 RepID=UPI001EE8B7FE|nr:MULTISPECIES: PAS domain-containing protein [unclassified Halorhodospira]MCG5541788.1 PAS domain-containing protein [Halorhodospira sp. M39old]MCG5546869.1 PAS domain-containing protein [Halorhodospira sp. M38]
MGERGAPEEEPSDAETKLSLLREGLGAGFWRQEFESGRVTADEQLLTLYGHPGTDPSTGPVPWTEALWREHVQPEDWARVEASFREAFDRHTAWDLTYRIRRADGAIRYLRSTGRVECDAEGTPTHLLGVEHDVTAEKDAERTQEELSQRLHLATSAANIGIWNYDLTSGRLEWDEGMFRLYGVDPATFGHSFEDWAEALLPGSRDSAVAALNEAVATRTPFNIRMDIRRADDGRFRTLLGLAQVVCDASGAPVRVVGVNQDVTEEEENLRHLAAAEAKFRGLFELSPVGIAMNDFHTGEFLDFNDAINGPAGYTREEFRALSYWDVTPEAYRPQELEQIESLQRTGRYGPFQKEYIHKDGHRYPVLLHGFKTNTPEGREVIWSIIQNISDIEQTRQALEDANNQLASLMDNVPGITFRCLYDEAWTVLLISQAAERVTGYAADELIHNATVSYAQLIHPDDLAGVDKAIAEAVTADHPWEVQYRLRRRDGSLRWVQERGVAVRNAQGDVAHMDGFVLDITEQRCAEEALQAAKERFAGIFEQTGSGVAVFRTVDEGRDFEFIDLNPASERIEQTSRDELIGGRLTECFPGVEEMGLLAALQRVADTGVPEELPLAANQDERITGWRENRIFRLTSGEVVAVYEDRTEIKQAQQESERAREQLANLAAQLPGFIYQYRLWPDGSSAFVYANEGIEKIYGTTPQEAMECADRLFEVVWKADRQGLYRSIEHSAQTLTPWRHSYRIQHPLKGTVWLEGHATPERLADGSTLWHGYVHDITDRVRAEQELTESKALLEEFFNQSIIGFFFMMLDEPIDWHSASEAEKESLLDHVVANQRMTKINQAMLDQYRATREDFIGLAYRDFFPDEQIEHSRTVLREVFDRGRARAVTHEQRRDGTPVIIHGDYTCLHDEHGRVTGHFGVQDDITERRQQQEALVRARKEAEQANRAKSEFLANMSHEIRTPMNAVIGLSQLLAQTELSAKQRDQIRKIEHSSRMLLGILNDINLEVATELLEKTGATVATAENGTVAVEAIRANPPDLVLMDLQMPVMDGYEAMRVLREEGYDRPILALSAAVMDEDRQRAAQAGADDHLDKPIESQDLYAALIKHLRSERTAAAVPDDYVSARETHTLPAGPPGFDLERGLRQLGGDEALYLRQLRRFRGQLTTDYATLIDHLRAGDHERASRLAHTLKGVAGTLGAVDLQQRAEQIDHALQTGHAVTAECIERLEQTLQDAGQALDGLAREPETARQGSPEAVTCLRQKLEASELIEEETFREALAYLRGRGFDCDALEALVEQFALDEALQRLDSLLTGNQEGAT